MQNQGPEGQGARLETRREQNKGQVLVGEARKALPGAGPRSSPSPQGAGGAKSPLWTEGPVLGRTHW